MRRAALAARASASLVRRAAAQSRVARAAEGKEGGVAAAATTGAQATAVAEPDPAEKDGEVDEISGDDPLIQELEERLRTMNGNRDLTLDMVLNPATIVNVEREVILLKAELKAEPEENTARRKELENKIEEKQMKVVNEMRQVMTDNLKLEFLLQGILSIPLFGALCYELVPLPDWGWLGIAPFTTKLILKISGVWGIWLLTVPALRSRKPGGPYGMGYEEKRALDLAFLTLPFIVILTPFVTRYAPFTFWVSLLTLVGLYVWSFNTPLSNTPGMKGERARGAGSDLNLPEPVMWALRSLDFATGSERGARREDESWQSQMQAYEEAAEALAAAKKAKQEKSGEAARGQATQPPAA